MNDCRSYSDVAIASRMRSTATNGCCMIRYCARPALSLERMSETSDGLIAYRLRHAVPEGIAHQFQDGASAFRLGF